MKIKCSYDKLIEIDELEAHPKNPNKHTKKQIERIAKNIRYTGIRHPIIVSKLSGLVIVGHGRLEAARLLKLDSFPVNFQEFDNGEEEYAFMVSDNALHAEFAELDLKMINEEIKNLGPDFDIDFLGLKDFTIDFSDKYDESKEDNIPEADSDKPETQLGDLIELGSHRLLCGDCTIQENVIRLMDGKKADMVFTDPPYNLASDSRNYSADVSKSMEKLKNSEWDKNFKIDGAIESIKNAIKEDCTIYIWTSHFLINSIWEELDKFCDFFSYLVWTKPNPMPSLSKRHPTWNSELCAYGSKGSKRIVNFPEKGHFLSVREVLKKTDGTHPTQKPIELIEPIIEFSSNQNSLVLDLFLGSGSTIIACEKTNRICYGMEIDPYYCDVIIERYLRYTNQTSYKLNGEIKEWTFKPQKDGAQPRK